MLVQSRSTKILIDNGLSYKQLLLRAAQVGLSLDGLEAVLITHEHGDHVKGVGILSRQQEVRVFATEATWHNMPAALGHVEHQEVFTSGDSWWIGDLKISSFSVAHDAADPVSFTVECEGAKLALATDLGRTSHLVRKRLEGSHALILESNYCPTMLRNGSYPLQIQQRIHGHQGHLSNSEMNRLLAAVAHEALQLVLLVHISAENNCPDLALKMASRVVAAFNTEVAVASQDAPTRLYEISA